MEEQNVRWPGDWQTPSEPVAPWRRPVGIVTAIVGLAMLVYFGMDLQYPLRERHTAREELGKIQAGVYGYVYAKTLHAAEAAIRDTTFRIRLDGALALLGGMALTGGWLMAKSGGVTSRDE